MARISLTWKQGVVAALVVTIPAAVCVALWLLTRDDRPDDLAGGAKPLVAEPAAIVPRIFLLGKTSPGAAYAVDTSDGIVLIDSGLDASAAGVVGQVSALGLDPERIKAVLLTHVHADHCLGAARLRERFGAKLYAGRGDCETLRAGAPRDAFFSIYEMPRHAPHPTPVDVELAGGEVIEMGDARFEVFAAPGHTPGSVCYLLERRGLRALFTGDVIQALNPATRNVLGTYAAYLPPRYRGNAADYLATLRMLRARPIPHLVLPGHPSMDSEPQNPEIGVERWHKLLDLGIAEMEQLVGRYEADGADFLDGTPKELLPGLRYLGDASGAAVYTLETSKGVFLFDAPAGVRDLAEFRRTFALQKSGTRKLIAVVLTSAGPEVTASLPELVREFGCAVVAPKAGEDLIRRMCPDGTTIWTEVDQAKTGIDARPIPLDGRGIAPTAHLVRWHDKTVLISGRIPQKLSSQSLIDLMSDVRKLERGPDRYRRSLAELRSIAPNLWLPAVPVHGQNANVYDRDWEEVIARNAEVFP
jgi:glyoxylase-like metal-dependent hydrolase (beta-lactamase superfamily II)